MNTTFERSSNSTDEWYTPKEIIDALGEFDLDPCAPLLGIKYVIFIGLLFHFFNSFIFNSSILKLLR